MPDKILISFCINQESKFAKKINKEEKLPEIRKILQNKLPEDSIFTLPDGSSIDKEDEDDYSLSEIIKDDKVYIKSESLIKTTNVSQVAKVPVKKNVPINGSKFICKKGDLDIYLYPKIEFSDIEKTQAIVFMVVGQTGCGKTTLLNSFINYILGIQIEDKFWF